MELEEHNFSGISYFLKQQKKKTSGINSFNAIL